MTSQRDVEERIHAYRVRLDRAIAEHSHDRSEAPEARLPGFDQSALAPPGGAATAAHANRSRSRPRVLVSVAATCLVAVGLFGIVLAQRHDQPEEHRPADQPAMSTIPVPSVNATVAGAGLELVRIEAEADSGGTTRVVLVFDGEVPDVPARVVDDLTARLPAGLLYAAQPADPSSTTWVCGDAHWFPAPGNPTVDVFIPSDWLVASSTDTPVVTTPGSPPVAKIITCDPREGSVQISIWGAASGRVDDVDVAVEANTIVVDIAPT